MSLTNEQIIEAIGQKSVMEIVELIKAMEETFGVTAAAATVAADRGGARLHSGWCRHTDRGRCRGRDRSVLPGPSWKFGNVAHQLGRRRSTAVTGTPWGG